jgi:hypothetical protein
MESIVFSIFADLIKQIEAAHCGLPMPAPVYEPVYWPGPPPVELGPPPTFPPVEVIDHSFIQLVGVSGVHYLVP